MNRVISTILVLCFVISCDDITEKDIRDDVVVLMTPAADLVSADGDVTFWWNHLEGATEYELTIASPDFDNPQELVLDTIIVKNQFTMTLESRKYEWCVTPINSAYVATANCRLLEIED